jgi:hypothetical protein
MVGGRCTRSTCRASRPITSHLRRSALSGRSRRARDGEARRTGSAAPPLHESRAARTRRIQSAPGLNLRGHVRPRGAGLHRAAPSLVRSPTGRYSTGVTTGRQPRRRAGRALIEGPHQRDRGCDAGPVAGCHPTDRTGAMGDQSFQFRRTDRYTSLSARGGRSRRREQVTTARAPRSDLSSRGTSESR